MKSKPGPESPMDHLSLDTTARQSVEAVDTHSDEQSDDFTECCLRYQEQSWRSGERCLVEELLQLFPLPNDPSSSDAVLTLICHERILREESGEAPTIEEYQHRFPQLADALGIQWEIDALLSSKEPEITVDDAKPALVKRIGRYEVLSELGRGAMGVVFLAWDPQLKRKIAIKRLRTGADSFAEEAVRISTEAEAVAQLQHPSIVQIFDVGEADELPYLAMEFCSGGTLAKRLDGKPISPRLAAELIRKICEGVAAAHQRRIIHRDLKPKNVLLEREGEWMPKVSDFGLAKLLDNDSTATASGSILGSPAYMAPEQAFGDGKRVGPAADIYSLGAILYECLTGRPPFLGVSIADTLEQVRQLEPVRVRQLEPHVPLDLETITHKCLRKDPQQRYLTVDQLQEDLSRYLHRRPILARRERWYESAGRLAKKHPWVAGFATASAILLMAVTGVSLAIAKIVNDKNARIRESEVVAKLGQAKALVSGARGIRLTHEPGQRFEALESIRQAVEIGQELNQPTEWYASLRDEAIRALVLPDLHISHFRTEAQKLEYSDFTDDQRLLALSFESGPISIRRLADHQELATIPRLDKTCVLGFIDNSRLYLTGMPSGAVELWNVEHTAPQRLWQWTPGSNLSPAEPSNLRAIDTKFAVVCDAKSALVLNTADGSIAAQFSPKPFTREPAIALHPTHPYLVMNSYFEPGVELFNWETGETILRYRHEGNDQATFTGAAWSKDGLRLALGVGEPAAELLWFQFDPSTKELTRDRSLGSFPGIGGGGPAINFNAKGDRLLVFGWTPSLGLADANLGLPLCSSFGVRKTVAGLPKVDSQEQMAGLYASPDDKLQFGMMKVAMGRERTWLASEKEAGGTYAVSDPGGRILAFALGDKLSIVDVASKQLLLSKRWPGLDIYAVFFTDQYLYVNSQEVVCRFPYQFSTTPSSTLTLGVPERVHIPPSSARIEASRDGKTVSVSCPNAYGTQSYAGGWAKLAHEPAARKFVDFESGAGSTVSTDGSIISLTTFDSLTAKSQSNIFLQCDHELELVKSFSNLDENAFSRDGTFMVSSNALVNVDDWHSSPRKSEGVPYAISSDGKQVASYTTKGVTCLSDTRSGNVYARIEGSNPVWLPDASQIVTRGINGRNTLYDLKLIRRGILELGIPWTGPDYANCVEPEPVTQGKFVEEIASVEIGTELLHTMDRQCEQRAGLAPDDGHLAFSAAMISINRRHWDEALERLNRACSSLPDAITPRQWRAYLLAEMRRWPEAIADANWVLGRISDNRFRLLRAQWLYHDQKFAESIKECDWLIANGQGKSLFIRTYGLRHLSHAALGHESAANADRDYFMKNTSDDGNSLIDSAFFMVNDDISLRQPILAKLFIAKTLELQTELTPIVRDTIGMVYFRNDEFVKAIDVLSPNLSVQSDKEFVPKALSMIAMSAAKLGDRDTADKRWRELETWQPPPDLRLTTLLEIQKLKFEAETICQ